MSQHVRRVLAALGLMAALLLAAPVPSRAAGLWDLPTVPGIAARVWTWLESLTGTPRTTPSSPRAAVRGEKQGPDSGVPVSSPAPDSAATADEGSAIDPNGRK